MAAATGITVAGMAVVYGPTGIVGTVVDVIAAIPGISATAQQLPWRQRRPWKTVAILAAANNSVKESEGAVSWKHGIAPIIFLVRIAYIDSMQDKSGALKRKRMWLSAFRWSAIIMIFTGYGAVGSALVWGARGREFKSRCSEVLEGGWNPYFVRNSGHFSLYRAGKFLKTFEDKNRFSLDLYVAYTVKLYARRWSK